MSFKKLLESKNISGYRLAKDTKIAQQTISDYVVKKEFGKMQIEMAKKIADYLEMSLDEFYSKCNIKK